MEKNAEKISKIKKLTTSKFIRDLLHARNTGKFNKSSSIIVEDDRRNNNRIAGPNKHISRLLLARLQNTLNVINPSVEKTDSPKESAQSLARRQFLGLPVDFKQFESLSGQKQFSETCHRLMHDNKHIRPKSHFESSRSELSELDKRVQRQQLHKHQQKKLQQMWLESDEREKKQQILNRERKVKRKLECKLPKLKCSGTLQNGIEFKISSNFIAQNVKNFHTEQFSKDHDPIHDCKNGYSENSINNSRWCSTYSPADNQEQGEEEPSPEQQYILHGANQHQDLEDVQSIREQSTSEHDADDLLQQLLQGFLLDCEVFAELMRGKTLVLTEAGKMVLRAPEQQGGLSEQLRRIFAEEHCDMQRRSCSDNTTHQHNAGVAPRHELQGDAGFVAPDTALWDDAPQATSQQEADCSFAPSIQANADQYQSYGVQVSQSDQLSGMCSDISASYPDCVLNDDAWNCSSEAIDARLHGIDGRLFNTPDASPLNIDHVLVSGTSVSLNSDCVIMNNDNAFNTDTALSYCSDGLLLSSNRVNRADAMLGIPMDVSYGYEMSRAGCLLPSPLCSSDSGPSGLLLVEEEEVLDAEQIGQLTQEEFDAINGADGNGPIMIQVSPRVLPSLAGHCTAVTPLCH